LVLMAVEKRVKLAKKCKWRFFSRQAVLPVI